MTLGRALLATGDGRRSSRRLAPLALTLTTERRFGVTSMSASSRSKPSPSVPRVHRHKRFGLEAARPRRADREGVEPGVVDEGGILGSVGGQSRVPPHERSPLDR